MTGLDIIKYWTQSADDALQTAEILMQTKKYHHALFFCHLAIEKLLKAKVVAKTEKPALPIHNLLQLTEIAIIKLPSVYKEQLREINRFNIEARYDDYKLKFYKKATKEFAQKWFSITQELIIWLKKN